MNGFKQHLVKLRRDIIFRILIARRGPVAITAGRCGFFGNLFMTLNGIHMCMKAGAKPVPFWDSRCLYFDAGLGGNVWDYYFEPITLTEGTDSKLSLLWGFKPDSGLPHNVTSEHDVRNIYCEIIRKHVVLKPSIRQTVDLELNRIPGENYVVGVHIRQTDAARGLENRFTANLDTYTRLIDKVISAQSRCTILLATDSQEVFASISKRYGKRLLALECIRSVDGTSVHGHYDAGVKGSPFQKGLDVIKDSYLLSKSDILIRTHSQITAFSLCLNRELSFVNVLGKFDEARLPWLGSGISY